MLFLQSRAGDHGSCSRSAYPANHDTIPATAIAVSGEQIFSRMLQGLQHNLDDNPSRPCLIMQTRQ